MFARFRDENALLQPETLVSGLSHISDLRPFTGDDRRACYQLKLRDGRLLAWAEFGHRHGYPILYMHRQGGCGLEAQFLHEAACAAGFRLIAVDRPGLGGSDFISYKHPADLIDDYIELLSRLRLTQVAVFSWGGGSKFALAMAARCPDRVAFLNLLSPDENSFRFSPRRILTVPATLALRALLALRTWRTAGNGARYLQRWREQMCYADRKQMEEPEVESILAGIARETTVQGVNGLAQDIWSSLTRDSNGSASALISSLNVPVHIWHGSADSRGRPDSALATRVDETDQTSTTGVFRHRVRRQGYLFFRHITGDMFRVARREIGISRVAAGQQLR